MVDIELANPTAPQDVFNNNIGAVALYVLSERYRCKLEKENKVSVKKAAYKNEPNGFKGLNWGVKLNNIQLGLFEIDSDWSKRDKDNKTYIEFGPKKKNKKIGNVELEFVDYNFWRGSFVSVKIKAKTNKDKLNLDKIFLKRFGKPTQGSFGQGLGGIAWKGQKTTIIKVFLKDVYEMRSVEMFRRIANENEKRIIDGVNDF